MNVVITVSPSMAQYLKARAPDGVEEERLPMSPCQRGPDEVGS